MKRLLLLAFLSISTLALNAQEISEDQWTLVSKKTADWCSNCGSWGWTFKNNLLEDQADQDVVFWMVHYSSNNDHDTPTAKAISNNLGGSGQPRFYVNEVDMNVGSFNTVDKREEFKIFIESLSTFPTLAGVGSTAVFDGEKITSTARVKFLMGFEGGDYWLSSYLVDDELVAWQQNQGNNAVHENILLHSFNGADYFGENIVTGEVMANQEFTVDGELDFSGQADIPDYSDGYSVVTVLWALVEGKYNPINLNRQPVTLAVNTKDILNNVDIAAFHLGAGQVSLNITSDQKIDDASILLFDINGQTVALQKNVKINSGENQVILEAQDLTLGTYVAVIESDLGSRSIKVSVQ